MKYRDGQTLGSRVAARRERNRAKAEVKHGADTTSKDELATPTDQFVETYGNFESPEDAWLFKSGLKDVLSAEAGKEISRAERVAVISKLAEIDLDTPGKQNGSSNPKEMYRDVASKLFSFKEDTPVGRVVDLIQGDLQQVGRSHELGDLFSSLSTRFQYLISTGPEMADKKPEVFLRNLDTAILTAKQDLVERYQEFEAVEEHPSDKDYQSTLTGFESAHRAIYQLELLRGSHTKTTAEKLRQEDIARAQEEAILAASGSPTERPSRRAENGVENERGESLLNELFDEGGVLFYSSLPSEYTQTGGSGFSSVTKNRNDGTWALGELHQVPSIGLASREAMKKLVDSGIHELVTLNTRMKPPRFEERKKGLFGKKERVEIEPSKPWHHSELVPNGKDEPLVELTYSTLDGQNSPYKDYTGRSGQKATVSIALPESLAKRAMQEIRQDPQLVRTLVERAALESAGISREDWEKGSVYASGHPIRPPYEAWRESAGGESKMYIEDPSTRGTFNASSVVSF